VFGEVNAKLLHGLERFLVITATNAEAMTPRSSYWCQFCSEVAACKISRYMNMARIFIVYILATLLFLEHFFLLIVLRW